MTENVVLVHRKRFEASLQTACKLRSKGVLEEALIGLLKETLPKNTDLATLCPKCWGIPAKEQEEASVGTEEQGELGDIGEVEQEGGDDLLPLVHQLLAGQVALSKKLDEIMERLDTPTDLPVQQVQSKKAAGKATPATGEKPATLDLTFFECSSCGASTSARGRALERFNAKQCPTCWAKK